MSDNTKKNAEDGGSSSDKNVDTSLVGMSIEEKRDYLKITKFPMLDDVTKYQKVIKIGHGTYGEIFKAYEKDNSSNIVTLKRLILEREKEGFPINALREIRYLQQLEHNNIVQLVEICREKITTESCLTHFYLVFEFCEHDLSGLLSNPKVKFQLSDIKSAMKQLLDAIFYIHSNNILHRDIKPANILITKTGLLKLCDFGLAKAFSSYKVRPNVNKHTTNVVTLWYRPPEILLEQREYGKAVDLWSTGCVLAEMWTRTPILPGMSEIQQLKLIMNLCGSITPVTWPGVERLALFKRLKLPVNLQRQVKKKLMPYVKDPMGLDLIDKLLTIDPNQRINAHLALYHEFFWTDPLPTDLISTMSQYKHSMFAYFKGRHVRP